MIRLIALILSLSVCLFLSAVEGSQGLEGASVVDSILSDSNLSSQRVIFHAKNYEQAQAKLNSGQASLGSHHKQGNRKKTQPEVQTSNSPDNRGPIETNNKSGPFSTNKSVFDIRIPGDPRSHFENQAETAYKSVKTASWIDQKKNEEMAVPGDFLKRLGSLPKTTTFSYEETPIHRLEIQVSHSTHIFKLIAHTKSPGPDVLYECKIGLGAPEFPTPVGVYYVTHIYDQDPWWIPPPNRAWAAGDSPSKRVYGGTMAPLLKKRTVTSKKKDLAYEDRIEGPVKLEDYGYRFHGTNAPRSIGRNQSHGCVRMLSDDARKVAAIIEDKVGIVERKESENGSYAILNSPVRLNLIK